MSPEHKDYIRYRLDRAREAMQAANGLIAEDHLNDGVNRLYYACFYAVSALLFISKDYAKSHKGVLNLFDLKWVKTGLIPGELGKFYHRIFNLRIRGDYVDFVTFEREEVDKWYREAEELVNTIADIIDAEMQK
jgi:hypothetical protein